MGTTGREEGWSGRREGGTDRRIKGGKMGQANGRRWEVLRVGKEGGSEWWFHAV